MTERHYIYPELSDGQEVEIEVIPVVDYYQPPEPAFIPPEGGGYPGAAAHIEFHLESICGHRIPDYIVKDSEWDSIRDRLMKEVR